MKSYFLPRTNPGEWSAILIVVLMVSFAMFYSFVAAGERGGMTFFSNLLLAIPMVIAGISGIAAFVVGLVAMLRYRERSILVYITTAMGLFVLIFSLGEILFPH
jgi:hypothetical protein